MFVNKDQLPIIFRLQKPPSIFQALCNVIQRAIVNGKLSLWDAFGFKKSDTGCVSEGNAKVHYTNTRYKGAG